MTTPNPEDLRKIAQRVSSLEMFVPFSTAESILERNAIASDLTDIASRIEAPPGSTGSGVELPEPAVLAEHRFHWPEIQQITGYTADQLRALAAQPAPDVWKEEAERLGTCIEIAIKKMREPVEYLEQALREHKNYLLTDGKSHG